MIAAIRRSEGNWDFANTRKVMAEFGISHFHLVERLGEARPAAV
jgi:hypothetical protein